MMHDPLYAFFIRWGYRLPLRYADDFRTELGLLVTQERANERRRLCEDHQAYQDACGETERETMAVPT